MKKNRNIISICSACIRRVTETIVRSLIKNIWKHQLKIFSICLNKYSKTMNKTINSTSYQWQTCKSLKSRLSSKTKLSKVTKSQLQEVVFQINQVTCRKDVLFFVQRILIKITGAHLHKRQSFQQKTRWTLSHHWTSTSCCRRRRITTTRWWAKNSWWAILQIAM
jgi:hypothetical protein